MPDLTELLTNFRYSAFRLETLSEYAMDEEAELFESFLRGEPLPEWTPGNNSWLRMVADHAAAGRTMSRVHLVTPPLCDYLRFEFAAQVPSARAGEDIRVADVTEHRGLAHLEQDFWLFDSETVLLQHYDDKGRFLGSELTTHNVGYFRQVRDQVLDASMPLMEYLTALGA
jgi:hypothetical protein